MTVMFVEFFPTVLPNVALHMYVPASEAASGLNVSVLMLPIITTPDVIMLSIGSIQVIFG